MTRHFAWGCLLLGLLILTLGFLLFDRLMEQPRPLPPPATPVVVVLPTPTLMPVVTMSPAVRHVTKTPTAYAPYLFLPARSPLPTATSTPTPTVTPVPPTATETPVVPMRQRG